MPGRDSQQHSPRKVLRFYAAIPWKRWPAIRQHYSGPAERMVRLSFRIEQGHRTTTYSLTSGSTVARCSGECASSCSRRSWQLSVDCRCRNLCKNSCTSLLLNWSNRTRVAVDGLVLQSCVRDRAPQLPAHVSRETRMGWGGGRSRGQGFTRQRESPDEEDAPPSTYQDSDLCLGANASEQAPRNVPTVVTMFVLALCIGLGPRR